MAPKANNLKKKKKKKKKGKNKAKFGLANNPVN
jgi:hypothetical protein